MCGVCRLKVRDVEEKDEHFVATSRLAPSTWREARLTHDVYRPQRGFYLWPFSYPLLYLARIIEGELWAKGLFIH